MLLNALDVVVEVRALELVNANGVDATEIGEVKQIIRPNLPDVLAQKPYSVVVVAFGRRPPTLGESSFFATSAAASASASEAS
jgi:hypothetical protein